MWLLTLLRVVSAVLLYIHVRHDISTTFYIACQLASAGAITALQLMLWWSQEDLEKYVKMTTIACTQKKAKRSEIMVNRIRLNDFKR